MGFPPLTINLSTKRAKKRKKQPKTIINTKNGKDFPGGSVTLLGGSFGRRALNAEYGGVDDVHNLDYFVSINKGTLFLSHVI